MRVVKGIFVTRDRPFFFPVKCEMGYFFLVNRDFHTSREAWFCKIIIRETRNKCLIRREPWFSWWLLFRELWKDRFIFRETWSRPPLYHPHYCTVKQLGLTMGLRQPRANVSCKKNGKDWSLVNIRLFYFI